MASTFKQKTWRILNAPHSGWDLTRFINLGLVALILANVFAFALGTIPGIAKRYETLLWNFEVFSVLVFSVEYLIRFWACTADEAFRRPILGRLRYALTPLALIDLVAILPFYLPWLGLDLRELRVMRLGRLFRMLKLGRYSESLHTVGRVFRNKRPELVAAVFVMFLIIVVAASLLHFAEGEAQPLHYGTFPDSMWWAAETMTTVGYGDVVPKTPLGKVLASVIAIVGIGMFALPTAILGAGFLEEANRRRDQRTHVGGTCPHCGRKIES